MPVTSFYKQVVELFLEGKLQWSFVEHKDAGSQLGYGCTWSHRGCVVQRPAATALSRMLRQVCSVEAALLRQALQEDRCMPRLETLCPMKYVGVFLLLSRL